jgi:dTDP-glucose 4,6-dehydratase
MILVTGGAGFIGANFVLNWLAVNDEPVINLDKLTYAGNLDNLSSLEGDKRHLFVRGDIGDRALVDQLLAQHKPRAVINFAAESHVDRSIHGPEDFIQTNIVGTFHLLESVRGYWSGLSDAEKAAFRLVAYCRLMRFMGRWKPMILRLPRPGVMSQTALIRHPRQHRIIWFAPIIIPMAYRC